MPSMSWHGLTDDHTDNASSVSWFFQAWTGRDSRHESVEDAFGVALDLAPLVDLVHWPGQTGRVTELVRNPRSALLYQYWKRISGKLNDMGSDSQLFIMSTDPDWTVVHYQINGGPDGQGEGAVYLLVDKNPTSTLRKVPVATSPLPEVKFALLIDGGYSALFLQNLISLMTTTIPANYCAEYGLEIGKTIKFDSVIITHWDQDHFYSFSFSALNLMNERLTGLDTEKEEIRCFKYSGSKANNNLKPLTKIFMQWYNVSTAGNPIRGCLKSPLAPKTNSQAVLGKDGSENGPFEIWYPDAELKDGTVKTIRNVALGWTAPTEIIGHNLFNGQRLPKDVDYADVNSLTMLLTKNDPWTDPAGKKNGWKNAPGFYIFGSRKYWLGEDINKLRAERQGLLGVVDNASTATQASNPNSIQCLLVWRTHDTDFAQHRISLYTGGDCEWAQENHLIAFVPTTVPRIKMVKAGHHGSRSSSSIKFIERFNPEHWLYSAGRQHGHPAPDVIAYLGAYWANPVNQITGLNSDKRLHAVCYPYLLVRTIDDNWDGTLVDENCVPAEKTRRFIQAHSLQPQFFRSDINNNALTKAYLAKLTAVMASTGKGDVLTKMQTRITNIMKISAVDVKKAKEVAAGFREKKIKLAKEKTALGKESPKDAIAIKQNAEDIEENLNDLEKADTLVVTLPKHGILQCWNVLAPWIKEYWDLWSDAKQETWPMKYFGNTRAVVTDDPPPLKGACGPAVSDGFLDGLDEIDVQNTFLGAGVTLKPNAYVMVTYVKTDADDAKVQSFLTSGVERRQRTPTRLLLSKKARTTVGFRAAQGVLPETGTGNKPLKRSLDVSGPDPSADDPMDQPRQRLQELIVKRSVERQLSLENPGGTEWREDMESYLDGCQSLLSQNLTTMMGPVKAKNMDNDMTDGMANGTEKGRVKGIVQGMQAQASKTAPRALLATPTVAPTELDTAVYPIALVTAKQKVYDKYTKTDNRYMVSGTVIGNTSFVRFLNMQFDSYIKLAKPVASKDAINDDYPLDPFDTLRMWFDAWMTDPKIDARKDTLKVIPSLSLKLISNTNLLNFFKFQLQLSASLTLNYSSQSLAIQKGFLVNPASWTSILTPQGFLSASTTLCLGLASDPAPASLQLADLYALMGQSVPFILNETSGLSLDPLSQNTVWFTPGQRMQTVWRMTFRESPATLKGFLKYGLDSIKIENSRFCGMRASHYEGFGAVGTDQQTEACVTEGKAMISAQITLLDGSNTEPVWDSFMTTTDKSIELRLQRNQLAAESVLTNIVNWVANACKVQGFFTGGASGTNYRTWLNQLTQDLYIREFVIQADRSTGSWVFTEISLTFEVDLTFGIEPDKKTGLKDAKIPLLLKFSRFANGSTSFFQFKGEIWTEVSQAMMELDRLNPESEMISYQWPLTPKPQYNVYLPGLFTDPAQANGFPAGLPQYVTMFNIELSSTQFSFAGALCSPRLSGTSEPSTAPINLTSITIMGTYVFKQGVIPASCTARLDASFLLVPRLTDPQMDSTRIAVGVAYNNGKWTLQGGTQGLNIGSLYALFPQADSNAVMNALEQIRIVNLDITYTYNPASAVDSKGKSKAGSGSDFVIDADILLGPVELKLDFAYGPTRGPGGNVGWMLGAALSLTDDVTCTIGDLFNDISPDLGTALPGFIFDLSLTLHKDTTQLDLNVDKASMQNLAGTMDTYVIFSLILQAGDLDFEFYQIADTLGPNDTVKKYILRITLNKLPSIPGIPLLDEFVQPFDQADLIWSSADLTRLEVDTLINPICVERNVPIIYYQDPRSQGADPNVLDSDSPPSSTPNGPMPQDIVLTAGCHFMIIVEENNTPTIILDYPFLKPPKDNDDDDSGNNQFMAVAVNDDNSPATDQGMTKPLTNSQGPLTISAIGLKFDEAASEAEIFFDATIKFGGFECILKGFGLRFPVTAIGNWTFADFHLLITGIEVSVVRPPLTIAGEFIREDVDSYFGGLVVGFDPYSFVAGGYYGKVNDPITKKDFSSLFAFLMVNGPIASIEVVTLSGLKAGFGYNSHITLPSVSQVSKWCFLQNTSDDSTTPLMILDAFSGKSPQWIAPADGPLWFAAGVTGQLMNSISLQAVIVVSISSNDVVLGVLAEAVATFPLKEADPGKQLARIDLGIIAQIDFAKGVASIEGQLAPSSFLLSQECHLTGGFAIYYWFAGSGHEGDWMLSIGGYHPAYKKPAWYPTVVPVGISWQYDASLSISGRSYLALTPKCFMAGAHMALVYNSGRINASLSAYGDFLINFSPFAFTAGVGAHVSFSYRAGVGCLSHTLRFDFGIDIDLYGPPLAGVIHVVVSVVSFDIVFGPPKPALPAALWNDFAALLRQNKAGKIEDDKQNPPETNLLRVSCTSGLQQDPSVLPQQNMATKSTVGAAATWYVDASTFSFQIKMMMPANALVYNESPLNDTELASPPTPTPIALSMKPMQIQGAVTSRLFVTLKQDSTNTFVRFGLAKVITNVPAALFSQYDKTIDPWVSPSSASNSPLLDPTGATIPQWTALTLLPPAPTLSTQRYTLFAGALLRDVSRLPTDPASYRPSIAPIPLSTGQSACLTMWAPTTGPPDFKTEATAISVMSAHCSWMTLSDDAHGIGQPLLPNSWCKLAGAHPDGAYATKLGQILGGLDMGFGGGRPRSFFAADTLAAEFGGKRVPVCTQGRVVDRPDVVRIP